MVVCCGVLVYPNTTSVIDRKTEKSVVWDTSRDVITVLFCECMQVKYCYIIQLEIPTKIYRYVLYGSITNNDNYL